MGVQYPLYTHVHHGYGLNDAFDRSVTLLLESAQPSQERPDQAPSREPPFTAGEERGAPDPRDENRNPDAMKSFQSRDDGGGGRAPRGLLQAEDVASFGMDDFASFGLELNSVRAKTGSGRGGHWRSLLRAEIGAADWGRSGHKDSMQESLGIAGQLSGGIATSGSRSVWPSEQAAAAGGEPPSRSGAGVGDFVREEMAAKADVEDARLGGGDVAQRRLTEPHVVEHPCLHKGYSSTYRRMVSHGELPKPAMVQLVGR